VRCSLWKMKRNKPRPVVVERTFTPDAEACVQAVRLLDKEAAGTSGGEDDATKGSGDGRAENIIPER
jgi:hypothetical protein